MIMMTIANKPFSVIDFNFGCREDFFGVAVPALSDDARRALNRAAKIPIRKK